MMILGAVLKVRVLAHQQPRRMTFLNCPSLRSLLVRINYVHVHAHFNPVITTAALEDNTFELPYIHVYIYAGQSY